MHCYFRHESWLNLIFTHGQMLCHRFHIVLCYLSKISLLKRATLYIYIYKYFVHFTAIIIVWKLYCVCAKI